jgi:hypothetical protein
MADFYKLRSMLPVIYNKYLVVKWQPTDLYHNLFSVIDAVIATHGPWKGYNVFVDWPGSDNPINFHSLFNLDIKNEFAHSFSDIPTQTLNNLYPGSLNRYELTSPPSTTIAEYGVVELNYEYDKAWLDSSTSYTTKLKNTCVKKVKPTWNLQKSARGFYRGKFKSNVTTMGVDATCINEDNIAEYISVIDSVMRNNIKFRLFVCGVSPLAMELIEKYRSRVVIRKPKLVTVDQNSVVEVGVLSLCDFLVGSTDSYKYNYAKQFIESTNLYHV